MVTWMTMPYSSSPRPPQAYLIRPTTSRTVVPGTKYDGPAGGEDGLDEIASSNYSHQRGPIKPELVLSGKQCAI